MTLNEQLNKEGAIIMLESVFEAESRQLPESKSIRDLGGGYVEMLKTKAKVVLYFGFDSSRNRCQIVIDIDTADVLLWTQAIAERIWNKETKRNKYSFTSGVELVKEKFELDTPAKGELL